VGENNNPKALHDRNDQQTRAGELLDLAVFFRHLDTRLFAQDDRLRYFQSVDSTNTQALRLAQNGERDGTVLLTETQTAGKGRVGRRWIDTTGQNALLSVILRPQFPPHLLIQCAAVAVVEAIARTCNLAAQLKWPNDVLLGTRKVAGILIETGRDFRGETFAVIGIGINANASLASLTEQQALLSHTDTHSLLSATTLSNECRHTISRELLISHVLHALEGSYLALQEEARQPMAALFAPASRLLFEQWRGLLFNLGHPITLRQGTHVLSGIAEDVNPSGELVLRLDSGGITNISWGDVDFPSASSSTDQHR
jgi:BirA family biotin operon repressor/biotin-[acetyl-CoA-carboxylase] ligase